MFLNFFGNDYDAEKEKKTMSICIHQRFTKPSDIFMTPNQCVRRIVYQHHIITQKVTTNIVLATISDFLEDGTFHYIYLVRIGCVTISTPFETTIPMGTKAVLPKHVKYCVTTKYFRASCKNLRSKDWYESMT